ncbi:MAG: hypothetical protein ABIO70_30525 [Pseudomonadota bacterium]
MALPRSLLLTCCLSGLLGALCGGGPTAAVPQEADVTQGADEWTFACPSMPGVSFRVPAVPGWPLRRIEPTAQGCRALLGWPDGLELEVAPQLAVERRADLAAGSPAQVVQLAAALGLRPQSPVALGAGGARWVKLHDPGRWTKGYEPRPAQWDHLLLCGDGAGLRLTPTSLHEEQGYPLEAVVARVADSAVLDGPALRWLRWRAEPAAPSPWEAWARAPLWAAQPDEEGLLRAWLAAERGIELCGLVRERTQPSPDRAALRARGATVAARGERSLVLAACVPPEAAERLLAEGWEDASAAP